MSLHVVKSFKNFISNVNLPSHIGTRFKVLSGAEERVRMALKRSQSFLNLEEKTALIKYKTLSLCQAFIPEPNDPYVKVLDSAIRKSEIPENTILYRGIRNMELKPEQIKPGMIHETPCYVSTTFDPDMALSHSAGNGVVFKIHAPKGTKGVRTDDLTPDIKYEDEVLLARGVKYRFDKVTETPYPECPRYKYKVVDCTLLK